MSIGEPSRLEPTGPSTPHDPVRDPSLTWHRGLWRLLDGAVDGWVLTSVVRDTAGQAFDFRVEYMNEPGLAAVDLSLGEAIGRTYRELFPAVVQNGLLDAYLTGFERGTDVHRSVWYDDGRVQGYYDLLVRPFGAGFAMCFANRTDLVRSQEREESEQRLRAVLDASLDGFLLLSPVTGGAGAAAREAHAESDRDDATDFVIDYVNRAGAALVGRSADTLVGQRMSEAFPSAEQQGWLATYRRVVATGEGARFRAAYADDRLEELYEAHAVRVGGSVVVSFRTPYGPDADLDREPVAVPRRLSLQAITAAFAGALTTDDLVTVVADRVVADFGADRLMLAAANGSDETLELLHWSGPGAPARLDAPEVDAAGVAAAGKPRFVTGARSWAVLPLHVADRQVGVCALGWNAERAFTEPDKTLLTALSGLLGQALERVQLHDQERRLRAVVHEERLFLETVLDNLVEGVVVCDAEGRLIRFNDAAERLHGQGAAPVELENWAEEFHLYGPDGRERLAPDEVPLARALAGERLRDAEMVIAPPGQLRRHVRANGQRLVGDDGRVLGAVAAMHDVTDRKQAESRLERQALHDPLTALPNRRLLLDRTQQALQRSQRSGARPTLLFFDLDRFKIVNDSLGHAAGDRLLVSVAQRLRKVVRPHDTIARIGGDEFVVLCADVDDAAEASAIARRVQGVFRQPFDLGGSHGHATVGTSIGVALADDGDRPEDLIRKADQAMYQAKDQGRGRYQVFDARLGRLAAERLATENSLRAAIDGDRLVLQYQPIVDLDSGDVVACEALLRYRGEDGALVAPQQFLDVAEDSGLIVPIGQWVAAEVRRQLARWDRMGAVALRISVNLSGRQLASRDLLDAMRRDGGDHTDRIDVEITESILMEAAEPTLRLLRELKGVGRRLGLDDFGTGYSSLTYLRRFPVDFLKIDRSFVNGLGRDEEDTVIVTAVIELARALGLVTVAEGVETAGQLDELRRLGCTRAQGFHLSRPVDADDVPRLVAMAGSG